MEIFNYDNGSFSDIKEVEDFLRANVYEKVPHYAWNFYGEITFDGEVFTSSIFVFGCLRGTISNTSLEDLITETNDKWGWD